MQGQRNKGEGRGKKLTYCFLRHVIGLTLLALKLCMMDPSPSTHCWKTWKYRNTKLGKLKREKVGKLVLGEGSSSLQLWIMLITWVEEKNLPASQPITPQKCTATFYPLLFHPSLNKAIALSILPSTTCSISGASRTVYCQRQAVHWLIY